MFKEANMEITVIKDVNLHLIMIWEVDQLHFMQKQCKRRNICCPNACISWPSIFE